MRVETANVSKRFGKVQALRDVAFELAPGDRVALIGPNGAGKSTLTRVLMGMLGCEGTVLLDGLSPLRDRMQLAMRMAYAPQIAPRLAATVGELIKATSRLRGLDPARITEFALRLGLDTEDKRRVSFRSLSGGMRQKLLLALALSADSDLLILDEPTASLDVHSRHSFFDMVDELERKPTLILCSHRIEEIRHLVDKVLILQEGEVAFFGSATDYLAMHAGGMFEVRASGASHDTWLEARGFRRRDTGWWTMSIANGQRVELVHELSERLGKDIADIVVRDLENVDPNSKKESRQMNLRGVLFALFGIVVLVGAGLIGMAMVEAQTLPKGPSDLVWDRTACGFCRMHVGEPAFAAQLQTKNGDVLGFDDPGCLFLFVEEEKPEVHAMYFRHMKEDRWIASDKVAFLSVSPTPMGFGVGAVDKGTEDAVSLQAASQRIIERKKGDR